MSELPRQTRTYLMSLFERHGMHPRHDLGQNFLIDLNLHDFIIEAADPGPDDVVLEVGTGTGALTSAMVDLAAAVVSVEYDPRVFQIAGELPGNRRNLTLINRDALKNKNHIADEVLAAVETELAKPGETGPRRLKLVANLPYNVATPVISNIIATELPWSRMVVTIQYELAERMAAAAGSSQYSALTAWLQAQCQVRLLKKLGPSVFWPRPQVDSAVVLIEPDEAARARIVDRAFLHDFLRDVFTQRRKRMRGVVASMYRDRIDKPAVDEAFTESGIAIEARAEELPPADLVRFANALQRRIKEC
jgi:16S rRNA (adenine1518-N6/adenine1519-N6)-dimethyltransferase